MNLATGLKQLNNNTYFAGVLILLLNIGSKFVTIELSPTQEAFIRNNIGRQLLIFSMVWVGTKDLYVSFVLTGIFVILTRFILNEHSNFCILPDSMIHKIDTNNDGFISDEELEMAMKVLSKAKKQKDLLAKNNNLT
jgi:hypothetical protein